MFLPSPAERRVLPDIVNHELWGRWDILLSWGALSHRSSHDSGHWSWWSFWSLHSGWFWWLAKALRKFWGASGDFELLRGWPCTCWYITCTSSCLMAPVCRTYGLRSATLVLANWWQSCVGCVDFSQCRSNYGLAFITVEYFPAFSFIFVLETNSHLNGAINLHHGETQVILPTLFCFGHSWQLYCLSSEGHTLCWLSVK